ncbi:hypothetical protein T484DRAFT_1943494 [Baffinella frigidus]|nr:hypothetical protein T484DRAFT_1943494 [Cryptophyta sp. CCMP2293]
MQPPDTASSGPPPHRIATSSRLLLPRAATLYLALSVAVLWGCAVEAFTLPPAPLSLRSRSSQVLRTERSPVLLAPRCVPTTLQVAMSASSDVDETVQKALGQASTIAVVGATKRESMPVYGVMKYLQNQGYRCIPVNPSATAKGESIHGEKVYARVSDIPDEVQLVDIFLRSDRIAPVFEDVVTNMKTRPVLWTQLGIVDEDAAAQAHEAGCIVVMDRCPAIEIPRLGITTPSARSKM